MAQATPTPPAAFEPGGAVKLSDGGINLSGAQFMRLDKKVRAMLESADTDNDGNMSLDELSKVMEITLQTEMRNRNLKILLKIGAAVCGALILCIVGLSTATSFALKDQFTVNQLLSDNNDGVIQTGDAAFRVPLLAAPTLPLNLLQTIDLMTMTVPIYASNGTVTGTHLRAEKVSSVDVINDVRITFNLATGDYIQIWDGDADIYEVDPNGNVRNYPLCTTDVTCAAFEVSSASNADAYLATAQAALEAAGFSITSASGRRRLEEADANGCYADATNAIADNTTIYCPEPSGSTDCSTFWPEEISWTLKCVDSSGATTADINDGKCGCLSERTTNIDAALQSSCTLTMKDTYGDGWNGHSLRLVNFDAPTTLSLCTDVSYYYVGACVDADGGITLQNGGKDADVVVTWTLLSSSQMLVYRTGTTEAGADCYYDTNLVGTGEGLASDADVDGGVIAWRQDDTAASTFFTGAFSVCPPPSPPPPSPSAPPPPPLSPGESYEYSVEYQVEVEGAIGDFDEDTYTTNLAALLSPQSVSKSDIVTTSSASASTAFSSSRRRLSQSFYVISKIKTTTRSLAENIFAKLDGLPLDQAKISLLSSITALYAPLFVGDKVPDSGSGFGSGSGYGSGSGFGSG